MQTKAMKNLLRKDLVASREILILGISFVVLPIFGYLAYVFTWSQGSDASPLLLVCFALFMGSRTSALLGILITLMLTALIIAGERRSGTANFVAYLPPSRRDILVSKMVICLCWIALVWLFDFFIADVLVAWVSDGEISKLGSNRYGVHVFGLAVFGITWLASCNLESPFFSMLAGFFVPIALMILTLLSLYGVGYSVADSNVPSYVLLALNLAIFLIGLTAGWKTYLNRVEP